MKIQIKKKKNGKITYMYPSLGRIRFFASQTASKLISLGYKIDILITYEKGFTNEKKNCSSADDVKWVYQAFVKEYL